MTSIENLSILIVTWKGDDLLENCLKSIAKIYGDVPEIVIVDNANHGSTKELASKFSNVKYIPSSVNLGFAGGNNLGFQACTRKYVLLLNNDTVVHKDSFLPMIAFLQEHPHVAVVQGKMRLVNVGDVLDTCGVMLTPAGVLHDQFLMKNVSDTMVSTRVVYSAKGALMLLRRDIVDMLGGVLFHDHFHCNHEEIDFCHRIWLYGFEVFFVDTPPIDHLQSQTITRLNQVEVAGRTLSNQLFSLLTTLELQNAVKMVSCILFLSLAVSIYKACKGDAVNFKSFVYAVRSLWRRRARLVAARNAIQSQRKISDAELFGRVMIRPPWAYYYYALRGDLTKCRKRI